MTDDQNLIVEILVKYALYEPLSEEETRLLEAWRSRSEGHNALPDQLRDPKWIAAHKRLLQSTPAPIVPIPVEHRIGWRRPVLAVAIVLTLVGGWMLLRQRSSEPAGVVAETGAWVETGIPVNDQALLTREDGRILVLDTVPVGGVVDAGVWKTDDQTLTYEMGTLTYKMNKGVGMKQRLTVGRAAGPWRILLADGSRVVLRPGSSLEYSADLRSGKPGLQGEAWFGIARDASRPLTIATAGGAEVRVLGTTFDIVAPPGGESESKVALFSGAVRVRKGGDSIVLKPGQAAVAGAGATGLTVRLMADSERMASWRGVYADEEFFVFENTSLRGMLKELAPWYGVRVSNPDNIEGVAITGKLPRSLPLKDMLKALERVEKGHARLRVNVDTILVLPGKPGG